MPPRGPTLLWSKLYKPIRQNERAQHSGRSLALALCASFERVPHSRPFPSLQRIYAEPQVCRHCTRQPSRAICTDRRHGTSWTHGSSSGRGRGCRRCRDAATPHDAPVCLFRPRCVEAHCWPWGESYVSPLRRRTVAAGIVIAGGAPAFADLTPFAQKAPAPPDR